VTGAVPEHRDVLRVRPGTDVRQARAHVVRLDRQDLDLRAPVVAVPPPGAQEPLVRHRACDRREAVARGRGLVGELRLGAGRARNRGRGSGRFGELDVLARARDTYDEQEGEHSEHTSEGHRRAYETRHRPERQPNAIAEDLSLTIARVLCR